jgi:hypothetical protein
MKASKCKGGDATPPVEPADQEYEVGYRKPPKQTRFKPGQSGNPKGRRKGVRNLTTDVKRTLKAPVKIKGPRGFRNVSTQEGALMLLREQALNRDQKAIDKLINLAFRFNNDTTESGSIRVLSESDEAILAAYEAEIRSTCEQTTQGTPASNQQPDVNLGEDQS